MGCACFCSQVTGCQIAPWGVPWLRGLGVDRLDEKPGVGVHVALAAGRRPAGDEVAVILSRRLVVQCDGPDRGGTCERLDCILRSE